MIPIGEVFNRLDQEFRAGNFAELDNIADIYRDTIHLSEIGQFVAVMTVFATVFKQDPTGLGVPNGYYEDGGAEVRLSNSVALQLQGIIWDVVSKDRRAGVMTAPVPVPSMLLAWTVAAGFQVSTRRRKSIDSVIVKMQAQLVF